MAEDRVEIGIKADTRDFEIGTLQASLRLTELQLAQAHRSELNLIGHNQQLAARLDEVRAFAEELKAGRTVAVLRGRTADRLLAIVNQPATEAS
jgi:hypothetical protein